MYSGAMYIRLVYPSSCLNLGLMEYCFYSFAKVVRIYQLSKKAFNHLPSV